MDTVLTFINAFVTLYLLCIFAWVLLGWFPLPYNPVLNAIRKFLDDVVGPYIRLFRGIIPPLGGGGMQIDLSPLLAVFTLIILRGVLESLLG